jgi:flagellar L-ring protein FlgH
MLHSDAQAFSGGSKTAQTEIATVERAKQAARAAAHFDFHEASAISVILPLRNLKRLETRAPFALPRCALLGVLLVAALSAPAQSLWRAETSRSMVSDHRARAIGDVLTIVVQENNTASKDNSTSTKKDTSIDAAIATFLYSPAASGFLTKNGQMPALKTKASQAFDGGGTIKNEEKITSRIGVRVLDTLPNGNLVIEGRRTTSFSGESQDVVLRGVVRAEDISPNNTVFSYNIADATIKYVSKGTITSNQRKGWFTKIWEIFTPF